MKHAFTVGLVLAVSCFLAGCIPYIISPPNSGPGSWGFGYTVSHGGGIDPVTQAGIDASAANP